MIPNDFTKYLISAVDFGFATLPRLVPPKRIGPGKKSVGKLLGRRAELPEPLTRQLRRQLDRLAAKGRALI